MTSWVGKENFGRIKWKIDAEMFQIPEHGGGFVIYSFTCPAWEDELILFGTVCDVGFLLNDRQGVHLNVVLSLHARCFV